MTQLWPLGGQGQGAHEAGVPMDPEAFFLLTLSMALQWIPSTQASCALS